MTQIPHVNFDPDPKSLDEIGNATHDFIKSFLGRRDSAPASDLDGAHELARSLKSSFPEEGTNFDELLSTVAKAAEKSYDTTGPGYLAYIPGGGLYAAAVGDLLACITNRFVNISAPAPALVQLESNVTRWLCDLFAFPEGSQGILTSGGSMANFSAIVTARDAVMGDHFDDATIYLSDQVHHSITKSAHLAGLPRRALRVVPTKTDLTMDTVALKNMISQDRREKCRPLLVVGSAGTVNIGAVDPLDEIAEIARNERIWFHVDGAYGGFFHMTQRGRPKLDGIESADSITLDPHKGLFLPYGTGSLIVRNGDALRNAHRSEAGYLPESSTDVDLPDFADYSPELSRDFRGLRVWLPLRLHGVRAFRDALEEKLDLARKVYEALSSSPSLDVPWEPDLSIVAFRPSREDNEAADLLLERINDSRRVFVSGTTIDGRKYVRICVLSHRTDENRIDEAIEIVQKAAIDL
ncbi:MAG: aminotransferase class V-fold PLP-dependent enzyme [Actinomycetota bacterium]|nr:aminotransferase class V-fold PLP-dependent enzyme [Actinomycetota bacterium]